MLAEQISTIPPVYDPEASARLVASLGATFGSLPKSASDLVEAIGGASPYLSRLIINQTENLDRLFNRSLDESMSVACRMALGAGASDDVGEQMQQLRHAKNMAALTIAVAEISGAWTTMRAAAALSDFADAALSGAVEASLHDLRQKNGSTLGNAAECGLTILAMGKHGARELNYSSDIDVIALYDPARPALGGDRARETAIALTKNIVRLMHEQTADGYVFRTDLRLRPDPGVSAAAVSVNAAETYYEVHGQNWERAAFIKARPAAGDLEVGETFLKALRPFVWRKYLDFAAIEDIHSIKRQIHVAKGGGNIEFLGHDLKTGRGGIREIELLVQTQQLILGGKKEDLRVSRTIDALEVLCHEGKLSVDEKNALVSSYEFLRSVEHRIQMINDEQTHKIPTNEKDAGRLAAFLGMDDAHALERKLTLVLQNTHKQFAALFEKEDNLSTKGGTLSFTGVDNNPETLKSLSEIGFQRPVTVSDALRFWHSGGLRATRSIRARELLTKFTPTLLESLGNASDPDEAFVAFDKFLTQLPSGVQIFSLFANSPMIFERLIQIMTVSPYLGRELAKHQHLIEALLEHAWPFPKPTPAALQQSLAARLQKAETLEDKLNQSRRWTSEEKFHAAAQLLLGYVTPNEATEVFSDIADIVIAEMLPVVWEEMKLSHGTIDGELAIVGLGRLGARAMTATSDIDLIFIYHAKDGAQSTGPKVLDSVTFFSRLVRRFVTAISTVTQEGFLYEIDMQLRPSGGSGPAAVSKSAFVNYFENDAWTWEVMALTKARLIAGDQSIADFLRDEIDRIILKPRNENELAKDVDDMRTRLLAAKPARGKFDVKNAHGGLVDLEFIQQFSELRSGKVATSEGRFEGVRNELGDSGVAELLSAHRLFEAILQVSRAATGDVYQLAGSGLALQRRVSKACGTKDLQAAETLIDQAQDHVKHAYARLVKNTVKTEG